MTLNEYLLIFFKFYAQITCYACKLQDKENGSRDEIKWNHICSD